MVKTDDEKTLIYNDPVALKTLDEYQKDILAIIGAENDSVKLKFLKQELEKNEDSFQDMIGLIDDKLSKRNIFTKTKDFIKEIFAKEPDVYLIQSYDKLSKRNLFTKIKDFMKDIFMKEPDVQRITDLIESYENAAYTEKLTKSKTEPKKQQRTPAIKARKYSKKSVKKQDVDKKKKNPFEAEMGSKTIIAEVRKMWPGKVVSSNAEAQHQPDSLNYTPPLKLSAKKGVEK